MKYNFNKVVSSLILGLVFLLSVSCSNSDDVLDCIPRVNVNQTLFINNNLLAVGSTFIIRSGLKGIVVYRNSQNSFSAFDLQAPHLCPSDDCSTLSVSSGGLTLEGCDGSIFLLTNGQPVSVSGVGLIRYRVQYSQTTSQLNISN